MALMENILKRKVYILSAGFVAAIASWYFFGGGNVVNRSEVVQGLAGQSFQVHCSACNETFSMPVEDYMRAFEEFERTAGDGIKCIKCGAPKAWQTGIARTGFDPASMSGVDLSSREAVEDAIHAADLELADAKDAMARAEKDGDAKKVEEARAKLAASNAKLAYLNDMWDQRAMEQSKSGG